MCKECEFLPESSRMNSPAEYFEIASRMYAALALGRLVLVEATHDLASIAQTQMMPYDDIVAHVFQCVICGRKFRLHADNYHGFANLTVKDKEPSE